MPITPKQEKKIKEDIEKLNIPKSWTRRVAEKLVGRKIVKVRYMDEQEAEDSGFDSRPIVLVLQFTLCKMMRVMMRVLWERVIIRCPRYL
jgi:hypothetical protein